MNVLDLSEEGIQEYLNSTGQTLEQVKAEIAASKRRDKEIIWNDDPEGLISDKFKQPIGFDLID